MSKTGLSSKQEVRKPDLTLVQMPTITLLGITPRISARGLAPYAAWHIGGETTRSSQV